MTIINESGLYSLILSSKLPQAKEFKRWVTNEVLGYAKPENALARHVDAGNKGGRDSRPQVKEEDKTTVLIQHPGSNYKSKTIFINESGLYSLILSSKLPQTREFKRRVTSEVLGQTRKMGGYIPINGCDLVLWFYSSIIFRDTHTI